MVKVTGEYQGNFHCASVHAPSGSGLSTDAPKDNQGRGEAFSPTDLVGTALVTCMATTMAIVARQHGVDLAGLRYEVTKHMSTDGPRRVARLSIHLWMPAAAKQLPEGLMEKTARNCPVNLSVAAGVERQIEFHW